MPLFAVTVVVPYTLEDDRSGAVYPVTVQAVATAQAGALATAKVLVGGTAALRHPRSRVTVHTDRAKVGAVGPQVPGPYAYPLTRRGGIGHLAFPARIDAEHNESFIASFDGLDPANVYGVLMDCVHLAYINSTALGAIADLHERMNLQLFRVPENILQVLRTVGLERIMAFHPDLTGALRTLLTKVRAPG